MTKLKSLLLSIVLTIWAVSLYGMEYVVPALVVLGLAVLLFCLWLYKYLRDRFIIAQARLAHGESPTNTLEQTSEGSRRLFVPDPIDK